MYRVLTVAVALLAACNGASNPSSPVYSMRQYSLAQAADSVPLPYGDSISVDGVRLRLAAVLTDSRCPANAYCVWAGDAEILVSADPPCYPSCKVASGALHLHTHSEPRTATYLGYRVQLVRLQPLPLAGAAPDSSAYLAWLRVEVLK